MYITFLFLIVEYKSLAYLDRTDVSLLVLSNDWLRILVGES